MLIFEIVELTWEHQALLQLEKKRAYSTSIYSVEGGELKGTAGNAFLFSNVEVDLLVEGTRHHCQTNNVIGQNQQW